MFSSIIPTTGFDLSSFLICACVSLALGLIVAFAFSFRSEISKNFFLSLSLLPLVVQVVIMMVNGNVGTGVAVLGAFSLIRFRSVPGSAKDILAVFFVMAVGLATGMGYVAFAAIFTALGAILLILLEFLGIGDKKKGKVRHLSITIPEELDYTGVFNDIFNRYLTKFTLERVKTTAMGSMFELKYHVVLKKAELEKQMIDEIRCRNGNLPISSGIYGKHTEEL